MNFDNIFPFFHENGLICNLTKSRHLIDLNDPKILPCGSNACYKCIKKIRSFINYSMDCCCCKNVHKIKSVSALPSNKELIILFRKSCILQLEYSNKQWSQFSNDEQRLETLENNFNYMDEEIDIKLESLMIEIDNSLENIILNVSNFEKKILKKIKSLKKKFKPNANSPTSLKDLLENSKALIKLNKRIEKLFANSFKISFEKCEKFPKFGKLVNDVQFRKITISLLKQFEYEDSEIITLDHKILTAMCSLGNLHLIIHNRDNEILTLNSKFEIIKKSKIHSPFFTRHISSITSDNKENIYLSDMADSQIICRNINKTSFNKCIGLRGSSNSDFWDPCSICFYDDSFYVLDKGNQRVKVYSSNCIFKKNIRLCCSNGRYSELMENPNIVSVTQDIIAVSEDTRSIYIYNFDGYLYCSLGNQGYGVYSFLCLDNYLFIHGYRGSLRCYDLNKLKQDSILPEFERYLECIQNKSIAMSYFNERLVILFQNFNYLVAF